MSDVLARAAEVLGVHGGGTVEQIAARMWLSPNTIKSHLKRIYQAYGVHGRRELMEAVGE